jgi:hypothetical protein
LVKLGFLIVWFGCIKIYAQKAVNTKVGCTENHSVIYD